MAKVNKAYSLDIDTIQMIEHYTHGGENSRSALVNNAIKWYIRGDIHELLEQHKQLKANYNRVCKELYGDNTDVVVWWRRLLGLN
tara:strand:- start:254 stop:508 length:255 start_codon:yes stop_codon:yes gene_type:complete